MPHVLWELQGQRAAKFAEEADPHEHGRTLLVFKGYEQLTPGTLNARQYDDAVADLVAYLQWMGEPAQEQRFRLGVWVLLFLSILTVITWRLNAAFWKDVDQDPRRSGGCLNRRHAGSKTQWAAWLAHPLRFVSGP